MMPTCEGGRHRMVATFATAPTLACSTCGERNRLVPASPELRRQWLTDRLRGRHPKARFGLANRHPDTAEVRH